VIWKESTTPDDPIPRSARRHRVESRAGRRAASLRPQEIGRVVHATTLFTNALIERKGAARPAC
jgi:N-methylhydantoinase A